MRGISEQKGFVDSERPHRSSRWSYSRNTMTGLSSQTIPRDSIVNAVFEEMTGIPPRSNRRPRCRYLYDRAEDLALAMRFFSEALKLDGARRALFTNGGWRSTAVVSVSHNASARRGVFRSRDVDRYFKTEKTHRRKLRVANGRLETHQKRLSKTYTGARVQQSMAPKPIYRGGLRVDTFYTKPATESVATSGWSLRSRETLGILLVLRCFRPRISSVSSLTVYAERSRNSGIGRLSLTCSVD